LYAEPGYNSFADVDEKVDIAKNVVFALHVRYKSTIEYLRSKQDGEFLAFEG